MGLRLKTFRDRAHLTLSRAGERFGLSHSQVSRLENRRSDVTLSQLEGFAELYGCRVVDLVADDAGEITLVGAVGAGEKIAPFDRDATFETIEGPPGFRFGAAVVVRGDSMEPAYRDGDLLVYEKATKVEMEAIGRDCVCQTEEDDCLWVKILRKGSGKDRWNLISYNPRHEPLTDKRLRWAAPIRWIRRL